MSELKHLKNCILEAVQASNDADLLDLVYKLLLAERGDDSLDTGVLVRG